jgi:hypothetical protein
VVATQEVARELEEAARLMAGGGWVPGARVLTAIERAVPPGRASRIGVTAYKLQHRYRSDMVAQAEEWAARNPTEAVLMGRRLRARKAVEHRLRSGTWEAQPDRIVAAHYRGDAEFVLRSLRRAPGEVGLPISELARELGRSRMILKGWAANGLVPEPPAVNEHGEVIITHEHVEIYRKVNELYQPRGRRWYEDAMRIWQAPVVCPHCGGVLP